MSVVCYQEFFNKRIVDDHYNRIFAFLGIGRHTYPDDTFPIIILLRLIPFICGASVTNIVYLHLKILQSIDLE